MIRIYKYELKEIGEKFYWNDELFSGIIFDCNDGFNGHIFNSKKICKDGVIVGDYVNNYFAKYIDVKNCLEVHRGSLEDKEVDFDYEAPPSIVLYKNKPFTGIAYNPSGEEVEFIGGEYLHIDGQDDPANIEMEYADNGKLIYYSYNKEEPYFYNGEQYRNLIFNDTYRWDEEGQLTEIIIGIPYRVFEVKFEKDKLSQLDIAIEYFKNIDMIKEKCTFEIYEQKSFLENISAHNRIKLFGKGIDDEVFYHLYQNRGLEGIQSIKMRYLSLTKKSFALLQNLTNLYKLIVDSCEECDSEILKEIKKKNPNCYIEFNKEEIVMTKRSVAI